MWVTFAKPIKTFKRNCVIAYFPNISRSCFSVTSGKTLPTHNAVKPSGLLGLKSEMYGYNLCMVVVCKISSCKENMGTND